jgi:hypothetical protein
MEKIGVLSAGNLQTVAPFLAQLLTRCPAINGTVAEMKRRAIGWHLSRAVPGKDPPPVDVPGYTWPENPRDPSTAAKLALWDEENAIEKWFATWILSLPNPTLVNPPPGAFFVTGDTPILPYMEFDGVHGPFVWFPFSSRRGLLGGNVHDEVFASGRLADLFNPYDARALPSSAE